MNARPEDVERISIALDAVEVVLRDFLSGDIEVQRKEGGDPVTEADYAVDRALREIFIGLGGALVLLLLERLLEPRADDAPIAYRFRSLGITTALWAGVLVAGAVLATGAALRPPPSLGACAGPAMSAHEYIARHAAGPPASALPRPFTTISRKRQRKQNVGAGHARDSEFLWK